MPHFSLWRYYQDNIVPLEVEQERKQLERETMERECKSKRLNKKWGKPVIHKLTKDELEADAKLRSSHAHDKNYRLCVICHVIPTHLVSYYLKGASKIERYCESCIKSIS